MELYTTLKDMSSTMQKQLRVSSKSKDLQSGVQVENAHVSVGLPKTKSDTDGKVLIRDRQKIRAKSLNKRLKEARALNQKLKQEGKLPNPTKKWSKDSIKTLSAALSGK